jgi:hypothetical protein
MDARARRGGIIVLQRSGLHGFLKYCVPAKLLKNGKSCRMT